MSSITNWITDNPAASGLTVAVLIVVFGLLVYGLGDLRRFRFRRVWAIGGVVFRESIRRKLLWLTPLAMLGIVILTGMQRAEDELDAVRQTIQFCLFASGLLVIVSGIMLACTNLPRDIESKVIFTIVTKPTTRLEIVLGKVIGFARVTGSILVLMGVFTWAFLHVREWQLLRDISTKLSQPDVNEFARGRLEHHQQLGLLATRTMGDARHREIVARIPDGENGIRWVSTQQNLLVPFRTDPEALKPRGFVDAEGKPIDAPVGASGLQIRLDVHAEQVGKTERAQPVVRAPLLMPDAPTSPYGEPEFRLSMIDRETGTEIVGPSNINAGKNVQFAANAAGRTLVVPIDEKGAPALANFRNWAVVITPVNENFLIGVEPDSVTAVIPGRDGDKDNLVVKPDAGREGKSATLLARGNAGRSGQMLDGPRDAVHPVAVYHFDGIEPATSDGKVALELRMGIERLDDDAGQLVTQVEARVVNAATGQASPPQILTPENNRVVYADLPAEAFRGGKFDVVLKTITVGHAVTLTDASVSVVAARHSFGFNLAKALFSQWMLSILVVAIGFFCSTFVSWPIAIVLSLILLMGRWTVDQISDSLQPGIGALLATDLGASDAGQARVISATVDGLARMLNVVSQFLPNIELFSTGDLIERGLAITAGTLASSSLVLILFGLPLLTLSYVILRNKEVAP